MIEVRGMCPHCGSGRWYMHRMDYGKVKVLSQIARINVVHEWVKIQEDSALIRDNESSYTIQTDAVHTSRLYWFGLIDRQDVKRSGFVKINDNGLAFLKGTFKVPSKIWVHKGRVMDVEGPYIDISQVKDIVLDKIYWDNYPSSEA
jgi:CTP-dependent riboflavin kinase